MARAIISLSLSDKLLEHVRRSKTSKEMFECICNVFQHHNLQNKLRARRNFYTAEMKKGEKMLSYIDRIQQLGMILKSTNVEIDEKEQAMAILNSLPSQYKNNMTTLDALRDDSDIFTLDVVKSRLLQEEQRRSMRAPDSNEATLFGSGSGIFKNNSGRLPSCTYCKRVGHSEDRCSDKYPSLKPKLGQNNVIEGKDKLFLQKSKKHKRR